MEPGFIGEQVKNVWLVVSANARLIAEKNINVENAFVDGSFVLSQAASLYDAVADSVNIQVVEGPPRQFVMMEPTFLLNQVMMLQTVTKDNAQIQATAGTQSATLVSLSDKFILDLVTNLRDVVRDNAVAAQERKIQPNKLFMSSPDYVDRLVASFHRVLSAYARRTRDLAAFRERELVAARTHAELQAELDKTISEKAEALERTAELQDSLAAVRTECERLAAEAREAMESKAPEPLPSVVLEPEMPRAEDAELVALREEYKKLVKISEDHRNAAALAVRQVVRLTDEKQQVQAQHDKVVQEKEQIQIQCDRLDAEKQQLQVERDRLAVEKQEIQLAHDNITKELAVARESHDTFSLARAQEHDRLDGEIARLEDALQMREATANALAEENAQLKKALENAKAELTTTNTQLSASIIQCDTWKSALDDMSSRHAEDVEASLQAVAREKETADELLKNAAKKIEDLETRLRRKSAEIAAPRNSAAHKASQPALVLPVKTPVSPPPSSRKRPLASNSESKPSCSAPQGTSTAALNLASHGSPMPSNRIQELSSFSEITVDLGPGQFTPAIFTRQSLSNILGGSVQGLVVRCTQSATDLARKHDIQDYLCPNMDHNAWSPAGPGKHGYMQVGLGRDRKLFNDGGDYRHVFVGAGKHFLYCGRYHVLRVQPLTKEEWSTLPPKVKSTYSETTMNKEKSRALQSAEQVLRMYNAGELLAPCVRLQCVEFDTAFYQELVRANDQFFEHKPRPQPPPTSASGPAKRRRVAKAPEAKEDESEEEVSLALAVRSAKAASAGTIVSSSSIRPPSSAGPNNVATLTVDTSMDASSTAGPLLPTPAPSASGADGRSATPVAAKQTRSFTRTQSAPSALIRLRIPGGRASERPSQPCGDVAEPVEFDDNSDLSYLDEKYSSESDDDDLYTDD